ncbi:MAG TPA: AMP-binding protein [Longimicrobiaceae bacterium]|nr:AMP-binding protein [Longimicrobiaceae bacterium]
MDALNPNIAARLVERTVRHPERAAIVEYRHGRARRVSFGELAVEVQALAAGLRERGLGPGDRVLLFLPMSIDLYTALLACLHLGATVLFVDAWADRRRLDAAVAAAGPRAFLGTPKAHLLRLVSPAIRRIPLQLAAGWGIWRLGRYASSAGHRPAAEVSADAPALITLTTGSTGRPKAAARSHSFLWAQHEALAAHLGLTEADVDMPTLPAFVLNNLASGTTSVLPDFDARRPAEIDPAIIYRQLLAEGVTTSSGSPAFYQRLAGWCAATGRKLPLRALFTGGAPVLPPLARLLSETVTGEAHVVYGSTEAEPIAGIEVREMLAAMEADRRPDGDSPAGICVGRPVPQVELRLLHPTDAPITLGPAGWSERQVAPEEVGEVVVTGRHVLSGYLNDPEAERLNKIHDGERVWHRTGDAARLDAEGRLWLMGRVRERVQRAGQLWWGGAAEVRALEVGGITHAAYLGLQDAKLGQRAILCVETSGGSTSASDQDHLRSALAPLPVDEIRALARIPRDPRHASKTDVEALRRLVTG